MNRNQAEQLARRIEQENHRVRAAVQLSDVVGDSFWVVALFARDTGYPLGEMESPSDWDRYKQILQDHL